MPDILFFELEPWEREWLETRPELVGAGFYEEPLAPGSPHLDPQAGVVSVFIRSRVNQAVLDRLPALRFVVTRSTGYDHIDLAACRARGIAVSNVPRYGEHTVAEHTFGLILALSRKIHHAYVRTSRLDFSLGSLRGFDLRGKILGVVGTGNIGVRVIQIARGFGMRVLAFDVRPQSLLAEVLEFQYVPLEQLLEQADVVTLHVPLLPQTTHLIDRAALTRMKRGALLINTARGALVDTGALIEALDAGHLGGTGLDVLEGEEMIMEERQVLAEGTPMEKLRTVLQDYNLLRRENVIVTPHIAWYSQEAQERILATTVENIHAFQSGRPVNVVSG
ncbi:MAG: hydroxyacid dehydrogenase [Armatimonadetes bacterium]|nr:hydroxyacid dehydrogenase [Armatimonadota bacterium]